MCHLLLVEDDPDRVRLTEHAFSRSPSDPEIHVENDGKAALEHLRSADALPDLVLLDLEMPEVNGFQVLERIRSDPQLAPVPVVVLTSSTDAKDRDRCYRLGANAFVTKPVNFDEFAQVVEAMAGFWLDVNISPSSR